MRRIVLPLTLSGILLGSAAVQASVHNIHLYTDSSPDYVSIEDYVATATSVWDDPECPPSLLGRT